MQFRVRKMHEIDEIMYDKDMDVVVLYKTKL